MSLRTRLTLMIALVLMATLWVGALLTYWHAQRKVDVEMSAALEQGRESMLEALPGIAKSANPRDEIEKLIRTFDQSRHLRAMFVAPDARLIASRRPLTSTDVPRWFVDILRIGPRRQVIDMPAALSSTGSLLLEADPLSEIDEVWDDLRLKLLILGGFCAAVIVGVASVLGWALRPIDRILDGFEKVGRGDYSAKLPDEQLPEFARISDGFNGMTRQLDELRTQNAQLDMQLATVQEEERAELARDLHDEVSPLLFGAEVDARSVRALAADHTLSERDLRGRVGKRAEGLQAAIVDIKGHIRQLLHRLRPEAELSLGLADALAHLVSTFEMRHPGVAFAIDGEASGWGPAIDGTILVVAREAINNSLKHAAPKRIRISLRERPDGHIAMEIGDDGKPHMEGQGTGFGLVSMRERLAALGGRLTTGRDPGLGGVLLAVTIPVHATGIASTSEVTVAQDSGGQRQSAMQQATDPDRRRS